MIALAQLPGPELVSGWEQVGIIGILIALMLAAGWMLGTERVVVGARLREIKERCERLEAENREIQADFVRLTEGYERLGRDLISVAVRSGRSPEGRSPEGRSPEEEKDHGRS